jgi:hypothetical protein
MCDLTVLASLYRSSQPEYSCHQSVLEIRTAVTAFGKILCLMLSARFAFRELRALYWCAGWTDGEYVWSTKII